MLQAVLKLSSIGITTLPTILAVAVWISVLILANILVTISEYV